MELDSVSDRFSKWNPSNSGCRGVGQWNWQAELASGTHSASGGCQRSLPLKLDSVSEPMDTEPTGRGMIATVEKGRGTVPTWQPPGGPTA